MGHRSCRRYRGGEKSAPLWCERLHINYQSTDEGGSAPLAGAEKKTPNVKEALRGKFRKNRNIDVEHSSSFHCNAKTLYYIWLEGFSLEIIFRTVTDGLNFPASQNLYTILDISVTDAVTVTVIRFNYFLSYSTYVYDHIYI